jgi:hypothetical protein
MYHKQIFGHFPVSGEAKHQPYHEWRCGKHVYTSKYNFLMSALIRYRIFFASAVKPFQARRIQFYSWTRFRDVAVVLGLFRILRQVRRFVNKSACWSRSQLYILAATIDKQVMSQGIRPQSAATLSLFLLYCTQYILQSYSDTYSPSNHTDTPRNDQKPLA